ncbi:MAG: VWA domain-containing protein [Planctomycetaceae bacterium]|nr:VWA domain-containing protein [Planctomycetaceae bacterium]
MKLIPAIPRRLTEAAGRVRRRRGAALVLVAGSLVVLLAMAMFSVDVAYIQLTRTQLRAATDAAAKAGVDKMGQSQSVDEGIQAAIDMAAMNHVAGRPLHITKGDIEVGRADRQSDGSWNFVPNGKPYSALRVNSEMNEGNQNGAINLFFAGIFGSSKFTPEKISTAARLDQEVCLVLDRSHSMCFDLSGVDWVYPPGIPGPPSSVQYAPHPTKSRWAALMGAVDSYLDIVSKTAPTPRVALVTWASDITETSLESQLTKIISSAVSFDLPLLTDLKQISQLVHGRADKPMLGATNMAGGIDAGVQVLTATNVRPLAVKTMILMTDGLWNRGRNPVEAAQDARAAGIIIHVVSLLPNADSPDLDQIAKITGGRRYRASNAAELKAAFEEIARTAPVMLTE